MFIELKRETEERLGNIQDFVYDRSGFLIPLDELVELLVKISSPFELVDYLWEHDYA